MNKVYGRLLCTVLLLAMISGCSEKAHVSMEANALVSKFDTLVKQGKTTREQEQQFIHAVSATVLQLDRAIRGTNKADETRRKAEIEASTGIDLSTPLDLDK